MALIGGGEWQECSECNCRKCVCSSSFKDITGMIWERQKLREATQTDYPKEDTIFYVKQGMPLVTDS